MAVRGAVIEISYGLLDEWLHLPAGVRVDGVAPGNDFRSFLVRLRSEGEFLPEVADGAPFPKGMLTITNHEPTVEFLADPF